MATPSTVPTKGASVITANAREFPPPLPGHGLWQAVGGEKQAYVTLLSLDRFQAVVWQRGKGAIANCPHRHTSMKRAFQCAKDTLAQHTHLRIVRTQ